MSGKFQNYDFLVMDASFFLLSLANDNGENLLKELSGTKIYVPGIIKKDKTDTFQMEIVEYASLLSEKRRAVYQNLMRSAVEARMLYHVHGEEDIPIDTWDMILRFSNQKRRFAVVTGNQLLIDRIVLQGDVAADIYDLRDGSLIRQEDFQNRCEETDFQSMLLPDVLPIPEQFKIKEGSRLYRSGKSPVTLGQKQAKGAESSLFLAYEDYDMVLNQDDELEFAAMDQEDDPQFIAKIFGKGKLKAEKYQNIRDLIQNGTPSDTQWAIFPTDILYYDEECKIPVGMLERFVSKGTLLSNNRLYRGSLDSLTEREKESKLSDSVRLCRNIVRQVCWLNHFGFYISDYNLKNFAVQTGNENVIMFDTDSFGYKQYFGGYFAGNATFKEYDVKKKLNAINFCDDALYIFIFSLLSLGDSPIHVSENGGRMFKYSDPSYAAYRRRKLFPKKLWSLFADAFTDKRSFSSEALLLCLSECLKYLEQNPGKDFSYAEALNAILSPDTPRQTKAAGKSIHMRRSDSAHPSKLFKVNLWKRGILDMPLLIILGGGILILLYILLTRFGVLPAFP